MSEALIVSMEARKPHTFGKFIPGQVARDSQTTSVGGALRTADWLPLPTK